VLHAPAGVLWYFDPAGVGQRNIESHGFRRGRLDARGSLGHRPGLTDDLYALDDGQKPNQFLVRLERVLDNEDCH
jgi:hypothetical protein